MHEFTEHFKNVYTPNNGHDVSRSEEVDKILNLHSDAEIPFIDLHCLESCTKQLKTSKVAGSEEIINEHKKYPVWE